MEKIEQGKRSSKNKKKRLRPQNEGFEPLLKRPKTKGDQLVSNSPSPMLMNSSRPGSVISSASTMNGGEVILEPQGPPGSTDGLEASNAEAVAPGSTPGRKPAVSRLRVVNAADKNRGVKRTSAPLGGRGKMHKMQKSSKKGGVSRSAAAASAGAIAGAKAATTAAYAAYGLPPHHISPSPGGSPAISGSTHSSPRVSPVPMAFVATSLVTTPPTNKVSSKVPSSLTYAQK